MTVVKANSIVISVKASLSAGPIVVVAVIFGGDVGRAGRLYDTGCTRDTRRRFLSYSESSVKGDTSAADEDGIAGVEDVAYSSFVILDGLLTAVKFLSYVVIIDMSSGDRGYRSRRGLLIGPRCWTGNCSEWHLDIVIPV